MRALLNHLFPLAFTTDASAFRKPPHVVIDARVDHYGILDIGNRLSVPNADGIHRSSVPAEYSGGLAAGHRILAQGRRRVPP